MSLKIIKTTFKQFMKKKIERNKCLVRSLYYVMCDTKFCSFTQSLTCVHLPENLGEGTFSRIFREGEGHLHAGYTV